MARASIHRLLHWALKNAATASTGLAESMPDEEWNRWLAETIASPAFAEVSQAAGEFLGWYNGDYQARWVWVHCQDSDNWERVHQLACEYSEFFIFDRMAEITPSDRLEEWDRHVLHETENHGQIAAFCRWLPVELAGVLRIHFDHSDEEWGACAYQGYLAKSPEPVLRHDWRCRETLPNWQVKLLDRRLFAPEAIRPAPEVVDIQTAEWDFRQVEPFSRRGI
ncbi:MAG: hypothetical protein JWP63_1103 [Candidatus Solibacter sp.]|nr:hypothetical protein [Candidatus Solibacter sp.]